VEVDMQFFCESGFVKVGTNGNFLVKK